MPNTSGGVCYQQFIVLNPLKRIRLIGLQPSLMVFTHRFPLSMTEKSKFYRPNIQKKTTLPQARLSQFLLPSIKRILVQLFEKMMC